MLLYGLQTVLSLVQSVPYPPPPLQKKCTLPHPPQKRTEGSLCTDLQRRFSVYILRIHRLLMQTHKILTAGIGRLIRIFFISNRSDVCFIIKALPGVLKSWGERQFIFRAGPHYPHGPIFIVQKNLDLTMRSQSSAKLMPVLGIPQHKNPSLGAIIIHNTVSHSSPLVVW